MILSVVASHEFSAFLWIRLALFSRQAFSCGNGRKVPATSCARLPPFSVIWSAPLLQRRLGVLIGKRFTYFLCITTDSSMTTMEKSWEIATNQSGPKLSLSGYRGQTSPLMELEHHHLALVLTVRDPKPRDSERYRSSTAECLRWIVQGFATENQLALWKMNNHIQQWYDYIGSSLIYWSSIWPTVALGVNFPGGLPGNGWLLELVDWGLNLAFTDFSNFQKVAICKGPW